MGINVGDGADPLSAVVVVAVAIVVVARGIFDPRTTNTITAVTTQMAAMMLRFIACRWCIILLLVRRYSVRVSARWPSETDGIRVGEDAKCVEESDNARSFAQSFAGNCRGHRSWRGFLHPW